MLGLLSRLASAHRFGVESGDPNILRSIDKKVTTTRFARHSRMQRVTRNHCLHDYRSGRRNRETMQRTIDFAIRLDPVIANFSMMTPIRAPRSTRCQTPRAFLINDWEDYVFFEQKARYEMAR